MPLTQEQILKRREYARAYRVAHRDEFRRNYKKYYLSHLDKEHVRNRVKEKNRYHANIDLAREKRLAEYYRNRDIYIARRKEAYVLNPERFRGKSKVWYDLHKEKCRDRSKQFYANHRDDPNFIEKKKLKDKEYYESNKSILRTKNLLYYAANRSACLLRQLRNRELAKVELVCSVCGGKFSGQKDRKTCGRICQGEWLRRRNVEFISSGRYRNGYSSIEVLMRDELLSRNWFAGYYKDVGEGDGRFVAQYMLKGSDGSARYTVDFACPIKKIAIECDGEYWHAKDVLPENMTVVQKKLVANDKRKERYLLVKGWKLYRFWESSILEDVSRCVNEVNYNDN